MPHRLARAAVHRLAVLRRNTLVLAFWLLLVTAVAGLAAVVAVVLVPAPDPSALRPGTPHAVVGLALELPPLRLDAAEGLWVPILHGERVVGALVLAEGSYRFAPAGRDARRLEEETGLPAVEDGFTAAFLAAPERELAELQRRAAATPVADAARVAGAQERVAAFLREQAALLRQVPLGVGPHGVLRPSARFVLLAGRDYGRVRVVVGREVSLQFADLDRRVLTFRGPGAAAPASPLLALPPRPSLVLVFLSSVLMLAMLVLVLTADLERPAGRAALAATHGEAPLAAALLAVEAVWTYVAEALPQRAELDPAVLYTLLAGLVLTRPAPPRFRLAGVGLARHHLARALVLGLVVGVLGHLAAHLTLPAGLRETRAPELALQAGRAALLALAVEVYRRGLVQAVLERRLGRRGGLVTASLLFGLAHAVPRLWAAPAAWPEALLFGLMVVPATEALFGLMYDRTGTVVAGATARATLELLRGLLG